jgi:hypothetical protein
MLREVKCPRCTLVWYSEEDEGSQRLCPTCIDHLRKERERKKQWDFSSLRQNWYAIPILSGGAVLAALFLLSLTWPKVFRWVLLVVAIMMFFVGFMGLCWARYIPYPYRRTELVYSRKDKGWYKDWSVDPDLGGWSLVAILMALPAIGFAVTYLGWR